MVANSFIVLMLFLFHEGFYFLPEELTLIPGVFRMSDAFFVIIPFFVFTIFRTFSVYREESILILSFCVLMVISLFMGHMFFPQTYLEGILNIRHSFFWLSFFVYIQLIRNLKQADSLIKLLTALTGIYVIILLLTKYIPNLGIIHYPERYYNIEGALKRFGEFRLFFPYANIAVMLYFIELAKITHGNFKESLLTKTYRVAFILVVIYAVLSSYTRAVVISVLIVTAFAIFQSTRRMLQVATVSIIILLVSFQVLNRAVNEGGVTFLEDTKLGNIVFKTGKLEPEVGRKFQATVYLKQFMKSPFTGVGNFAVGRFTKFEDGGDLESYRAYGFFSGSDLGYLKILGENGLLGIAWLVWFFSYFYRRGKQILARATLLGGVPTVEVITRGLLYFSFYLLISGVTLGHWVHPHWITLLPLSLALMAITRVSVNEIAVTSEKAPLHRA